MYPPRPAPSGLSLGNGSLPPDTVSKGSRGPIHLTLSRLRASDLAVAFSLPLIIYLGTAIVLVLERHLIVGDALSRVGSATYMLFSRDPHLGAVGFVWGPLPTILLLPLVMFGGAWPSLTQDGFAASIISAIAMAGAVWQFAMILSDWRIGRILRWALIGTFALHPLIIQYGANGDSEALFLFLLMITVRQLLVWFRTEHVSALVWVGVALGLAYLTRYETIAAAGAVTGSIVVVTFLRGPGERRARALKALADGIVVAVPFTMAFVGWAMASWVIMGNPFEQFTSVYGTSAQLAAGAAGHTESSARLSISVGQVLGLEPFAWLAGTFGAIALVRRFDTRVLAIFAEFGSVLTFAVVAWLTDRTSGWLRYAIAVVPLTILLFAAWLSLETSKVGRATGASLSAPAVDRDAKPSGLAKRSARIAAGAIAVVLLMTAVPSTLRTMVDPIVGREDHYWGYEQPRYVIAGQVAHYVDALGLPDGSVLIDTFLGFPIVLDSARPRQFVITSDRDFQRVVADPVIFSVRYILVPEGGGLGGLDAIEHSWPSMYQDGSGIGHVVREFGIDGSGFRWRLIEVNLS